MSMENGDLSHIISNENESQLREDRGKSNIEGSPVETY
jgi:hypothetical protein